MTRALGFVLSLIFTFSSISTLGFSKDDHTNKVDGPGTFSNSGIRGPKYDEQINTMEDIAKKRPDIARTIQYGRSLRGNTLTALILESKSLPITKLALVTGATHGNEYLNIADRLAEALLNSEAKVLENYITSGGALIIVPIVNPDGYERRRRGNARNADVNRDWPNSKSPKPSEFKQPESLALANLIINYLSDNPLTGLNLALDYHCCVDGMLLKPWGYKERIYMTQSESNRYENFIDPMLKYFPKPGEVGTPPDLLYTADGTTLDYWYDKYGAISLTYEGTRRRERNNLQYHVLWWEDMLRNL